MMNTEKKGCIVIGKASPKILGSSLEPSSSADVSQVLKFVHHYNSSNSLCELQNESKTVPICHLPPKNTKSDLEFSNYWGYKWMVKREEFLRNKLEAGENWEKEFEKAQVEALLNQEIKLEKMVDYSQTSTKNPSLLGSLTLRFREKAKPINVKKLSYFEKQALQDRFATPCSSVTFTNCYCDINEPSRKNQRCTSTAVLEQRAKKNMCKGGGKTRKTMWGDVSKASSVGSKSSVKERIPSKAALDQISESSTQNVPRRKPHEKHNIKEDEDNIQYLCLRMECVQSEDNVSCPCYENVSCPCYENVSCPCYESSSECEMETVCETKDVEVQCHYATMDEVTETVQQTFTDESVQTKGPRLFDVVTQTVEVQVTDNSCNCECGLPKDGDDKKPKKPEKVCEKPVKKQRKCPCSQKSTMRSHGVCNCGIKSCPQASKLCQCNKQPKCKQNLKPRCVLQVKTPQYCGNNKTCCPCKIDAVSSISVPIISCHPKSRKHNACAIVYPQKGLHTCGPLKHCTSPQNNVICATKKNRNDQINKGCCTQRGVNTYYKTEKLKMETFLNEIPASHSKESCVSAEYVKNAADNVVKQNNYNVNYTQIEYSHLNSMSYSNLLTDIQGLGSFKPKNPTKPLNCNSDIENIKMAAAKSIHSKDYEHKALLEAVLNATKRHKNVPIKDRIPKKNSRKLSCLESFYKSTIFNSCDSTDNNENSHTINSDAPKDFHRDLISLANHRKRVVKNILPAKKLSTNAMETHKQKIKYSILRPNTSSVVQKCLSLIQREDSLHPKQNNTSCERNTSTQQNSKCTTISQEALIKSYNYENNYLSSNYDTKAFHLKLGHNKLDEQENFNKSSSTKADVNLVDSNHLKKRNPFMDDTENRQLDSNIKISEKDSIQGNVVNNKHLNNPFISDNADSLGLIDLSKLSPTNPFYSILQAVENKPQEKISSTKSFSETWGRNLWN